MRAVTWLGIVLCSACRTNPLIPDMRTPADFARDVEPRCKGFDERAAASLLSADSVDSVEPSYAHVQSGPGDREARLRGARVHIRPLAGLSRESIARNLECHESRVILGAAVSSSDDPYSLAGHWLDIDVDAERDGFVVRVEPSELGDFDAARDVLERAKRFASRHTTP